MTDSLYYVGWELGCLGLGVVQSVRGIKLTFLRLSSVFSQQAMVTNQSSPSLLMTCCGRDDPTLMGSYVDPHMIEVGENCFRQEMRKIANIYQNLTIIFAF